MLELREVDLPAITDEQVLVACTRRPSTPWSTTASPGPSSFASSAGLRSPKSTTVGADLAGRVVAVGKDVTEFKPGDEVFGTSGASWAEYAPAREVRLVASPRTSRWRKRRRFRSPRSPPSRRFGTRAVQPGQKVLINGASGGVGTYAVQLAKSFGADVTAVCSPRNVESPLARRRPRRRLHARGLHGARCARTTYDRHRGQPPFREYKRVLTPEATFVLVGATFPSKGAIGPLSHVIRTAAGSIGKGQTVKFFIAKIEKDDLAFMAELLEAGKVRSVIDRSFALSETENALRYLGEGHARGKVIITM